MCKVGAFNVFLDSNEYKRCGHNFSCTPMKKLKELSQNGTIQLLITNVVEGEVSQHIKKDVQSFLEGQRKLSKNAGVIRNIPEFSDIIRKVNEAEVYASAEKAFQDFITENCFEKLSSNGINNDALLSDYFVRRLPFEDNAKKAAEFKDAFIVYTLRKYADDNNVKIHVVSNDSGIRGSLSEDPHFMVFNRSEDLFGYITSILEDAAAENTRTVQAFIKEVYNEIADRIIAEINDFGVWVSDAEDDCDIHEVKVQSIVLSYVDEIDEFEILPTHIQALVDLTVDCTCIDEDNSYWDKEDGTYLLLVTHELRLTKTMDFDFKLTLNVDSDEYGKAVRIAGIDECSLDGIQGSIELDVEDADDVEVLHSSMDDYHDECPGSYTTCPDCGCKINFENDGGNGFCTRCAHKH